MDFEIEPPNSLNRKIESASTPRVFIKAFTPFIVPLERSKKGKLMRIRLHIRSSVLESGLFSPRVFVRFIPSLNLPTDSFAYGFGSDMP